MGNGYLQNACFMTSRLSRKPVNMSLAAEHNGVTYYITKEQWKCIAGLRHEFIPIGVTVMFGDYNFIVSLKNTAYVKTDNKMLSKCARLLPTLIHIYICEDLNINDSLAYFGGEILHKPMYLWDEDEDEEIYIYQDRDLYAMSYDNSSWIRIFCNISEDGSILDKNGYECSELSSFPKDSSLVVERDGNVYYLSQHQWCFLKEREAYMPIGVTLEYDERIIVIGLNDLTDEEMCWNDAYKRYSALLPSFDESDIMSTLINNQMYKALFTLFGGTPLTCKYWTCFQNTSIDMTGNTWINNSLCFSYNDTKCRCRAVYRIMDNMLYDKKGNADIRKMM